MRSPIGSLRCADAACDVRTTGAVRAGAASTSVSAGRGGGSGGGGIVAVGRLSAACAVGLAKNGAGCWPDCRKMALTMMIRLAALEHRIAAESIG